MVIFSSGFIAGASGPTTSFACISTTPVSLSGQHVCSTPSNSFPLFTCTTTGLPTKLFIAKRNRSFGVASKSSGER